MLIQSYASNLGVKRNIIFGGVDPPISQSADFDTLATVEVEMLDEPGCIVWV
jgi:hypothetical protein